MLTTHGHNHPREDTDHLYVPRKTEEEDWRRGEIIQLEEYVEHSEDPLMQLLGHTNATQIQHYFKQPLTSGKLFKATQSK
jgi:hypothetical protein